MSMKKNCITLILLLLLLSFVERIVSFQFHVRNKLVGSKLNDLTDYTHYLDYLPFRQEGLLVDDFRTAPYPPTSLRNRKMVVEILIQYLFLNLFIVIIILFLIEM